MVKSQRFGGVAGKKSGNRDGWDGTHTKQGVVVVQCCWGVHGSMFLGPTRYVPCPVVTWVPCGCMLYPCLAPSGFFWWEWAEGGPWGNRWQGESTSTLATGQNAPAPTTTALYCVPSTVRACCNQIAAPSRNRNGLVPVRFSLAPSAPSSSPLPVLMPTDGRPTDLWIQARRLACCFSGFYAVPNSRSPKCPPPPPEHISR